MITLLGLGGYHYYVTYINVDKVTVTDDAVAKMPSGENNVVGQEVNENNSEQNNNTINVETSANQYNYDNFVERVFMAENGGYYLFIYKNKTMQYSLNDQQGKIIAKYFGTFTINNDTIVFNILSGYNSNNDYVIPKNTLVIEFKIEKEYMITDLTNNIKLNRANQPVRAGGSPLSSFEDTLDNN